MTDFDSPPAPGSASRAAAESRPEYLFLFKLGLLLFSLALAIGMSEIALRLFSGAKLAALDSEHSLVYRYDRNLGWFPAANTRSVMSAERTFGVTNNSQGFRDPEPVTNSKPAIIFLGDSFVWGYNVEAADRFTDKLQAKHPEWSISNFGICGYGTDQEFMLLRQLFDTCKPRLVFLMFCAENDHQDNMFNVRYSGYYKPYYTIVGDHLVLEGIPVPRGERVFFSEHRWLAHSYMFRLLARGWFKWTLPAPLRRPDPTGMILRDVKQYVASNGAEFIMGLTRSDPELEAILRSCKIPYVDITTPERFADAHWTPAGHTFVAEKIDKFLAEEEFMAGPAATNARAEKPPR